MNEPIDLRGMLLTRIDRDLSAYDPEPRAGAWRIRLALIGVAIGAALCGAVFLLAR